MWNRNLFVPVILLVLSDCHASDAGHPAFDSRRAQLTEATDFSSKLAALHKSALAAHKQRFAAGKGKELQALAKQAAVPIGMPMVTWTRFGHVAGLHGLDLHLASSLPNGSLPEDHASAFLSANKVLLGFDASESLQIQHVGTTALDGGARVVRFSQRIGALPVFLAGASATVAPDGSIVDVQQSLLPPSKLSQLGPIPAAQAIAVASKASGISPGLLQATLGIVDPALVGSALTPVPVWQVHGSGPRDDIYYVSTESGTVLGVQPNGADDLHREVFDVTTSKDLPGGLVFDDICHTSGDAACTLNQCAGGSPGYTRQCTTQGVIKCMFCDASGNGCGTCSTASDAVIDFSSQLDWYWISRFGRDGWDNGACKGAQAQSNSKCYFTENHRLRSTVNGSAVGSGSICGGDCANNPCCNGGTLCSAGQCGSLGGCNAEWLNSPLLIAFLDLAAPANAAQITAPGAAGTAIFQIPAPTARRAAAGPAVDRSLAI